MIYTVVYVSDEYQASCYGRFSSRDAAERFADKCQAELDEQRDGEGFDDRGHVTICSIQRRSDW